MPFRVWEDHNHLTSKVILYTLFKLLLTIIGYPWLLKNYTFLSILSTMYYLHISSYTVGTGYEK